MSDNEDENNENNKNESSQQYLKYSIDNDTLRILVSTDNHIGYSENDPIRGLDSFAAFEEVLISARNYKCDLVLLAGDLFHENKPSRRTLHKTMEILRKYCMGPNPVNFQIVSNQEKNFRNGVNGVVNYEDEFYSVDMPIFSIHGNHDDPTRDGGTEMLAALDLLNVSNLINYFGRQDEVDKVEISPILMVKNQTKIALYGMGSIRDERLNRMWQNKKVKFLRPSNNDEWFYILALHQNRDLGRGSKNCIHESMIPEWMDLVIWGHEHECLIDPMESLVGTFRIIQPGSSVATSLTEGEAVQKKIGVLDIRLNQWRVSPIPLKQVRSFTMGDIELFNQGLNVDDPKVDEKLTDVLIERVEELVEAAREKTDNNENEECQEFSLELSKAKYKVQQPDQVLVRLKVDHSGFSTVNNQRFGARFVGQVANPSNILLFHRRSQINATKLSTNGQKSSKKNNSLNKSEGIPPEELESINIEDLINDNLHNAAKKLGILDPKQLGNALNDFVEKEQRQAFAETFNDLLGKKQKTLVDRGVKGQNEEGKVTTKAGIIEICKAEAEARASARERNDQKVDDDGNSDNAENSNVNNVPLNENNNVESSPKSKKNIFELSDDSPSEDEEVVIKPVATNTKRGRRTAAVTSSTKTSATKTTTKRKATSTTKEKVKPASRTKTTSRRAATSTKKQYIFNDDDSEVEEMDVEDDNTFVPKNDDDDDDDDDDDLIELLEDERPTTKKTRKLNTSSIAARGFTSSKKTPLTTASRSRIGGKKKRISLFDNEVENDDDDDDDVQVVPSSMASSIGGWGNASTTSQFKRRKR